MQKGLYIALLFILLEICGSLTVLEKDVNWQPVTDILQSAINDGAFPGCVVLVGNREGILFVDSFGSYTYGNPPPYNKENPPMTVDVLRYFESTKI